MKPFLSTLALLAMISTPAFAQKRKSSSRTAAPAAAAPAATPVYSYSGGSASTYSSGPVFSAAASLGSIDGNFMIGPSLFVEWPTNMDGNDLTFGAQTGIYFGSSNNVSYWALPIMATGKYNFRPAGNSGMIKPYVGLALGINLAHGSVAGFSDTSVKFAMLLKPGMNFAEGGKWFAELPIGTMSSGFVILPTFGYHF